MTTSDHVLSLPFLKPWWRKSKQLIRRLFEANTVDRLRRRLHILTQIGIPHIRKDPFVHLCFYLEECISLGEQLHFLEKTFPTILYLVLNLEDHPEQWSSLNVLTRNHGNDVVLERSTLASLLACSFLCLIPKQTSCYLTSFNFDDLFAGLRDDSVARAKMKCFINYFDVLSELISENSMRGSVKITRKVLPSYCRVDENHLRKSLRYLCEMKVKRSGRMEEFAEDCLKMDLSASPVFGETVLRSSNTVNHEDQLLCQGPDLLSCAFVCESLLEHEALQVSGCDQYSVTRSYSGSELDFVSSVEEHENFSCSHLCVANAISFKGLPVERQYSNECVMREFTKFYISMLPRSKLPQCQMNRARINEYASKLSDVIFREAKLQAQFMQNESREGIRQRVADNFADNMLQSLISDLPVAIRIKRSNISPSKPEMVPSTCLGIPEITVNVDFSQEIRNSTTSGITKLLQESRRSFDALDEFADIFASNLLRLALDQLYPKYTIRKYSLSSRRRSSSRSNSLTQSFSLYDIVYGDGDAGSVAGGYTSLKAAGLLREDLHSNFFLGDIEEAASADITVAGNSDISSMGSIKYNTRVRLSDTVATGTFFKGKKFPAMRDRYAGVLSTQILAEAIASYIKLLGKKKSSSSASGSLSPQVVAHLNNTWRGSVIESLDDMASYLADKIIVDALLVSAGGDKQQSNNYSILHTSTSGLVEDEAANTSLSTVDNDELMSNASQRSYGRKESRSMGGTGGSGSSSVARLSGQRKSSCASVSSQVIRQVYSWFLVALVVKVWSMFALLITQPFSSRGARASATSSSQSQHDGTNEDHSPAVTDGMNARSSPMLPRLIHTSHHRILAPPSSCESIERSEGRRESRDLLTVVTGNVGCGGGLGGDPQFKMLIQWLSATVAGINTLVYYPSGDSRLVEMEHVIALLQCNNATVSDVYDLLLRYCHFVELFYSVDRGSHERPKSFFNFIKQSYNY